MTINRKNEGNMIKPGLGNSDDAEADDEGLGDADNVMGSDESGGSIGGTRLGKDPSSISDGEEGGNPAPKVMKGRPTPKGHTPKVSGSIEGPGSPSGATGRNTLGHGERVGKISGSHMGQK
jgi:hypothetical protein